MKKRRIKYFVQLTIPNLYGKKVFAIGVQIDVDSFNVAPYEYISSLYAELKRQLDLNLKADVPENLIVVSCLSMLDIMEINEPLDVAPSELDTEVTMTILKKENE